VRQLLEEGTVRRPSLGLRVAELPPQEHARLARVRATDRPGLVVAAVAPDQPGAAAGVQVGDLLLEIAGHPVPDVTTVAAVLAEVRDRTTLTLGRDDERIQVEVELGEPHPPHDK
jgi:S1-C subfamily serine protease